MKKSGIKWKSSNEQLRKDPSITSQDSNLGLNYISSVQITRLGSSEFSYLKRSLLLPPLLSCLDKLVVLKNILNVQTLNEWKDFTEYRTPDERYSNQSQYQQKHKQEEYEGVVLTNRQKMQQDISFLTTVLFDGCTELYERGDYTRIISTIKAFLMEMEDDIDIEETQKQQQAELNTFQTKLIQERKELEESIKVARLKLHTLADICEDSIGYGSLEKKYTDKWETTRQNLNNLALDKEENVYSNCIQKYNMKIDFENRVHTELENYVLENTEDLQSHIMYWMQKYDDEIEMRDAEMLKLKILWEQLTEEHQILKAKYEKRCKEIEDYLNYKEQKRIAEELERTRIYTAIKIQAWWRGTMVRKQLGPFKPEKPKKANKKGDKKKKK